MPNKFSKFTLERQDSLTKTVANKKQSKESNYKAVNENKKHSKTKNKRIHFFE